MRYLSCIIAVLSFCGTSQASNVLSFDGIDDYIEVLDAPELSSSGGSSLTVETWVFLSGESVGISSSIITKYLHWNSKDWGLFVDAQGRLAFQTELSGNWFVFSSRTVTFNRWNHCAFVFDNDNDMLKLYLNGTLTGSRAISYDLPDTNAVVWIGGPGPFYFSRLAHEPGFQMFAGYLNEIRIWNVARTGNDIFNHMLPDNITGSEDGLVAYWSFNEGVGQTAYDSTFYGRDVQLGSTIGIDENDPTWTHPSVISPQDNENVMAGSIYNIQWLTAATIVMVRIDLSDNNGADWHEIVTTENTGSYDWVVPFVESEECLIRISDASNHAETYTSDAVFTIYRCRNEMIADLDNDCKVNLQDYALFAQEWLECGNEYDGSCEIDLPKYQGTDLLAEYELGNWTDLSLKGQWIKQEHAFRIMPSPGGGPDFGWSYSLPIGVDSFRVIKRFKMSDIGAIQVVFTETPAIVEGYGVLLSYKWYAGLSIGDLSSRSGMATVALPELSSDHWKKRARTRRI